MKLYISKATLRTIEKFGNASLTHISATPSDHMSVELDATPLANEASKPAASETRWYKHIDAEGNPYWLHTPPAAPSVEQDEPVVMIQGRFVLEADPDFPDLPTHSAWSEIPTKESADRLKAKYGDKIELRELVARAASTSANVAQGLSLTAEQSYAIKKFDEWASDKGLPAYSALLTASKLPSELTHEMYNAADAAGFGHIAECDLQKLWQTLLAANVAQGAVAVATVKVYETYTGQNGWTEVTQEEYDRTKDKYEHRIRRVPAPPAQPAITDAARDVLDERQRQVTAERWTPEHDDAHEIGELARAAACYAANATGYRLQSRIDIWPWNREWWKPTAPRRDLVKAGALILAEIERLDRRALTAAQPASEGNHAG